MKVLIALLVLTALIICDPTRASPTNNRVRRQGDGWDWGDSEESSSSPPTQPTQPTRPTQPSRPTQPTQPTQSPVTQPSQPTQPAGTDDGTTTTAAPGFTACIGRCQSTQQYNPVCGSDRVTYQNEQRLNCANRCGSNISKLFNGTCSPLRRRK